MFSTFTSWIQKSEEATQSLLSKAGLGIEAPSEPKQQDAGSEFNIQTPSKEWTAAGGSAADWNVVVKALLSDENTFLIAPARLLSETQPDLNETLARVAPNLTPVVAPTTTFDDIQTRVGAISSIEGVPDTHYALVPKLVADSQFWLNASWRLDMLARCTPDNVVAVFRLLNAEPRGAPAEGAPRQKNIGVVETNERVLAELEKQLAASRKATEWIVTKRDTIVADLSSCRSNAQLLVNLTSGEDNGSLELADSVADSCAYHKTKIASHIAELDARDIDELTSSGQELVPGRGNLYMDLLVVNDLLHDALAKHATWRTSVLTEKQPEGSPNSSSQEAKKKSSPVSQEATRRQNSGTPHASDEATFSATLPWDEDDE